MKKVILASVLAATAISANAQTNQTNLCSGLTAAGSGTAVATNSDATNNFVKTAFTPKCSANTWVSGQDGGTYYRVGSASTKGKNKFAGSSAGGGVAAAGSCAASGCASGDASTAMTSTYAPTS